MSDPKLLPNIRLISFGFKYHTFPHISPFGRNFRLLDLRRSVRNPYLISSLRRCTGLDKPVQDLILRCPGGVRLFENARRAISLSVKTSSISRPVNLDIFVGCWGGRHRSVGMVELIKSIIIHIYPTLSCEVYHLDLPRYLSAEELSKLNPPDPSPILSIFDKGVA